VQQLVITEHPCILGGITLDKKKVGAQLLLTAVLASVVFLGLFVFGLFNALSSSVLNISGEKNVLIKVFPQGWAFFSKSPRDDDFIVLDPQSLELAVQWPNASAENWFGLTRYGRAQGIEAGTLSYQVPQDKWISCQGDLKACLQENKQEAVEVVNDVPNASLCENYLLVQREPVPWSWAEITTPDQQPAKVVEVRAQCSNN
jgi:antimicrobial peptide system SdpA family protein